MDWLYLAAGSIIFFTSLNLLQRKLATESNDPRATAVVFNASAALISLVIFVLSGSASRFSLSQDPSAYVFLLLACLFYALFERMRFQAAKLLDASIFSTVSNVGVLVAFAAAVVLYGESITLEKLIGVTLILTSLVLISYKKNSKASKRGLLIALVATTLLGLGWSLDKKGATHFNPDTYSIIVWSLPVVFIYLFPRVKFDAIKSELKNASWKVFLLAGLNVIGYLLQLRAMTMTDATKVIPIVQTSTLFTVLAGIVILKERTDLVKKVIAGGMAVAGVFFLV